MRNILIKFFVILIFSGQVASAQHFFPDADLIDEFTEIFTKDETLSDGHRGSFSSFTSQTIKAKLKQQVSLQEQLMTKDWFVDHREEFRPLYEYGFGKKNESDEAVFGVTEAYLKTSVLRITEVNDGLKGKKTERIKNIRSQVEALIEQLEGKGLDGLISGTLGGFTKEQRQAVLSEENIKDKIQAMSQLVSEIDDTEFSKKFDYSKHDMEGKPESFQSIVEVLELRTHLVDTMMDLLALMYLIEDNKDISEESIEESLNTVFSFSKKDRSDFLSKIAVEMNPKQGNMLFSWFQRSNFAKEKKVKTSYSVSHVLAEVPPYIGIFRGCFGGDCSTSYSWAFPNSPFEKVFYPISKGKVVGYVSTTIVEIEGKRRLMVKDLQGPNISPEMADDILQFLHFEYAKTVGAEGLAMNNNFIVGQNNYQALRTFLQDQLKTHEPEKEVTMLDEEARKFFNGIQGSNGGYDMPQNHKTASLYVPPVDKMTKDVARRKSRLDFFNMSEEEMQIRYYRNDTEIVKQIILGELDEEKTVISMKERSTMDSLMSVLDNSSGLRIDQYEIEVQEAFGKFFTKKQIKEIKEARADQIDRAYLMAADAFNNKSKKIVEKNINTVIDLIKKTYDYDEANKLIGNRAKDIFENKIFQNFVDELSKENSPRSVALLAFFKTQTTSIYARKVLDESDKNMQTLQDLIYEGLMVESDDKVAKVAIGTRQKIIQLRQFLVQKERYNENNFARSVEAALQNLGIDPGQADEESKLNSYIDSARISLVELSDENLSRALVTHFEENKGKISAKETLEIFIKQQIWKKKIDFDYVSFIDKTYSALERAYIYKILNNLNPKGFSEKLAKLKEEAVLPYLRAYIKSPEKAQEGMEHLVALDNQYSPKQMYGLYEQRKQPSSFITFFDYMIQKKNLPRFKEFKALDITKADVYAIEELREIAYLMHFDEITNEALSIEKEQALTLEAISFVLSKEEKLDLRFSSRLVAVIESIFASNNEAFKSEAAEILKGSFGKENNENQPEIVSIILSLASKGIVSLADYKIASDDLIGFLEDDNATLIALVAEKLIKDKNKKLIKEEQLVKIASLLDNESIDEFPDAALMYTNIALKILANVKTDNEEVNGELKSSIKYEEDGNIQLKAAIAYVRNGNEIDEKLMKRINRNISKRGAKKKLKSLFEKETGLKIQTRLYCSKIL